MTRIFFDPMGQNVGNKNIHSPLCVHPVTDRDSQCKTCTYPSSHPLSIYSFILVKLWVDLVPISSGYWMRDKVQSGQVPVHQGNTETQDKLSCKHYNASLGDQTLC